MSKISNIKKDNIIVGNIVFSDYINEKEVSGINNRFRTKNIGECKIEVYGGEGPIPHFHIISINGNFDCCVRIYDNHFFQHDIHRDTLNSRQCAESNNWLKLTSDKSINPITNWNYIALLWGDLNPECMYPDSKKCKEQPKYNLMKDFRAGM